MKYYIALFLLGVSIGMGIYYVLSSDRTKYYHYSFITRNVIVGKEDFYDGIISGAHFPKATELLDSCKIARGTVDPNNFTIISISAISKEDYDCLNSDTLQYHLINRCEK